MPFLIKSTEVNYDVILENISRTLNSLILYTEQLQKTYVKNYDSQFHLIETLDVTIKPTDFINGKFTLKNENFKLNDSIISWSPLGEKSNIEVTFDCGLILLEQTKEGEITFEYETIPANDIKVVITIYVKGSAIEE